MTRRLICGTSQQEAGLMIRTDHEAEKKLLLQVLATTSLALVDDCEALR